MTSAGPDRSVGLRVTEETRVGLHALRSRREGEEEWTVGRVETGEVVRVAAVVHRAMALLSDGHPVGEVQARLDDAAGNHIDVVDLVAALHELGFVATVDGCAVDLPPPPRPSLPWLQPAHVRWLLHPATTIGALTVITAGSAAVALDPALVPDRDDLFWGESRSAALAAIATIEWVLVFLHELGHLATARAAGVPGRIRLSTRLLFPAAETDVTGIWVEPRRTRMIVYLAGIAVNLVIASIGVLVLATVSLAGLMRDLVAAVVLLSVVWLPAQLLIFMRTDVYFVIQDLTGCTNLYTDATSYLRGHARRLLRWARPKSSNEHEGTVEASMVFARERRLVRLYSVVLLVGTATALFVMIAVVAPTLAALIGPAIQALREHPSAAATIDGVITLIVVGGAQVLAVRAWWRRHRYRISRFLPITNERR